MVFNAIFNNISVISCQLVLLVEKTTNLSQVTDIENQVEPYILVFINLMILCCRLSEVEGIVLTPYEKNLDFWRQLWRVIERRYAIDLYCEVLFNRVVYKTSLKISKRVIRICKSKKDRQHNGQIKNDKKTNNNLQTNTQKTKDRATRTPLKTGGEIRCSEMVSNSCSTSGTCRVTLQ
jgi:hypothetical protein